MQWTYTMFFSFAHNVALCQPVLVAQREWQNPIHQNSGIKFKNVLTTCYFAQRWQKQPQIAMMDPGFQCDRQRQWHTHTHTRPRTHALGLFLKCAVSISTAVIHQSLSSLSSLLSSFLLLFLTISLAILTHAIRDGAETDLMMNGTGNTTVMESFQLRLEVKFTSRWLLRQLLLT